MSSEDFYAPPSGSVSDLGDSVDPLGDFDVVSGKIQTYSPLMLPTELCVKCGAHGLSGKTYDKKIYYTPKWIVFLILFNILILLIVHMLVRKKLETHYHLCPECVGQRRNRILYSVGGLVLSIVGFGFGLSANSILLLFGCGITLVASLIALIIFASPPLRASGHDTGKFTVKGASPEFLDQIKKRRAQSRERSRESSAVW